MSTIGLQGRAYVERHHSIPAVAARLGKLYIDTADFPAPINAALARCIDDEGSRRDSKPQQEGWQHPWRVG